MIRARWIIVTMLVGFVRLAAAGSVDLLLVAADDNSLQPLLTKLTDTRATTHAAWTCWTGRLGGKTVALTRAEGDPLNAVAATTLAIRLQRPKLIVVFGPGRAHDPELHAGDVVVSEKFAAFDGLFSRATDLAGGSHPLTWDPLPHSLLTAGEKETPMMTFPADRSATAIALTLKSPHGRVVAGILGSAHQVNRETDRVAWLRSTWHTSTEDGVSAHVAGCAALLAVPVVGICVVEGTGTDAAEFALRLMEAIR